MYKAGCFLKLDKVVKKRIKSIGFLIIFVSIMLIYSCFSNSQNVYAADELTITGSDIINISYDGTNIVIKSGANSSGSIIYSSSAYCDLTINCNDKDNTIYFNVTSAPSQLKSIKINGGGGNDVIKTSLPTGNNIDLPDIDLEFNAEQVLFERTVDSALSFNVKDLIMNASTISGVSDLVSDKFSSQEIKVRFQYVDLKVNGNMVVKASSDYSSDLTVDDASDVSDSMIQKAEDKVISTATEKISNTGIIANVKPITVEVQIDNSTISANSIAVSTNNNVTMNTKSLQIPVAVNVADITSDITVSGSSHITSKGDININSYSTLTATANAKSDLADSSVAVTVIHNKTIAQIINNSVLEAIGAIYVTSNSETKVTNYALGQENNKNQSGGFVAVTVLDQATNTYIADSASLIAGSDGSSGQNINIKANENIITDTKATSNSGKASDSSSQTSENKGNSFNTIINYLKSLKNKDGSSLISTSNMKQVEQKFNEASKTGDQPASETPTEEDTTFGNMFEQGTVEYAVSLDDGTNTNPLQGASVKLTDVTDSANPKVIDTAKTDVNGKVQFTITGALGSYKIEVTTLPSEYIAGYVLPVPATFSLGTDNDCYSGKVTISKAAATPAGKTGKGTKGDSKTQLVGAVAVEVINSENKAVITSTELISATGSINIEANAVCNNSTQSDASAMKKPASTASIIEYTVFDSNGNAVTGVEVTLTATPTASNSTGTVKTQVLKTNADGIVSFTQVGGMNIENNGLYTYKITVTGIPATGEYSIPKAGLTDNVVFDTTTGKYAGSGILDFSASNVNKTSSKSSSFGLGVGVTVVIMNYDNLANIAAGANVKADSLNVIAQTGKITVGSKELNNKSLASAKAGFNRGTFGIGGALAVNIVNQSTKAVLSDGAIITLGGIATSNLTVKANEISDIETKAEASQTGTITNNTNPGSTGTGAGGTADTSVGIGSGISVSIGKNNVESLVGKIALANAYDLLIEAISDGSVASSSIAGAAGGTSLVPVLTLDIFSNKVNSQLNLLNKDLTISGALTIKSSSSKKKTASADASASGTKAAMGGAFVITVDNFNTISNINGNVNASAVTLHALGANSSEVTSKAGANGAKSTDDSESAPSSGTSGSSGSSSSGNGSNTSVDAVTNNSLSQGQRMSGLNQSNGVPGQTPQKAATSEGAITVAASVVVAIFNNNTTASVSFGRIIVTGLLDILAASNSDACVTADSSATDSQYGVGVSVAILISKVNTDAFVTNLTEIRAGSVCVTSNIEETGSDKENTFIAKAVSGAGATSVGVAGAAAISIINVNYNAYINSSSATTTDSFAGDVTIKAEGNQVITTQSGAAALKEKKNASTTSTTSTGTAGTGTAASTKSVGVGASFSLAVIDTNVNSYIGENVVVSTMNNVNMNAGNTNTIITSAEAGESDQKSTSNQTTAGSSQSTPSNNYSLDAAIAVGIVTSNTNATIKNNAYVTVGKDLIINGISVSNTKTIAQGSATASNAAVGACVTVNIIVDNTSAIMAGTSIVTGDIKISGTAATVDISDAYATAKGVDLSRYATKFNTTVEKILNGDFIKDGSGTSSGTSGSGSSSSGSGSKNANDTIYDGIYGNESSKANHDSSVSSAVLDAQDVKTKDVNTSTSDIANTSNLTGTDTDGNAKSNVSSTSVNGVTTTTSGQTQNGKNIAVAAAVGANIIKHNVSAIITGTITKAASITVSAINHNDFQTLGTGAAVAKNDALAVGVAVLVNNSKTEASISGYITGVSGDIKINSNTTNNMSAAFKDQIAAQAIAGVGTGSNGNIGAAGAIAVIVSNAKTYAYIADNARISTLGNVEVKAIEQSKLALRAWAATLSTSLLNGESSVNNATGAISTGQTAVTPTDSVTHSAPAGSSGTTGKTTGTTTQTTHSGAAVGAAFAILYSNNEILAYVGNNVILTASSLTISALKERVSLDDYKFLANINGQITVGKDCQVDTNNSTLGTQNINLNHTIKINTTSNEQSTDNLLDFDKLTSTLFKEGLDLLNLIATNNYYVEAAGGAVNSNATFAGAGSFAIIYFNNQTKAYIGNGAQITITLGGDVIVNADSNVNAKAIGGAIAFSGDYGVGITAEVIANNDEITAYIGKNTIITGVKNVSVIADAVQSFFLLGVAGAKGDNAGVAGLFGATISQNKVNAYVDSYVQITAFGDVTITATDESTVTAILGGGAYSGKLGIGVSAGVNVLSNTVKAYVANGVNIYTTGNLKSSANSVENVFYLVANGAAGGASAAISASPAINIVVSKVNSNVDICQISANDIAIKATGTTKAIFVVGAAALGSGNSVAVGGVLNVNILKKEIEAKVSSGAIIYALGNLTINAVSEEKLYSIVVGLGVSSASVGAAGSISVNVISNSVLAELNGAAQTSKDIVVNSKDDISALVIAGGISLSSGSTAIGLSNSDIIVNGSTIAKINGNDISASNIYVSADSNETIYAIIVSGGISGGGAAVTGSINVMVMKEITNAEIYGKITALNDIQVISNNHTFCIDIVGSAGISGSNAFGVSLDTVTYLKNVTAVIDNNSIINAYGNLIVNANNEDFLLSISAGIAVGGSNSVNGSVVVLVVMDEVTADIGKNVTVNTKNTSYGNVTVSAYNHQVMATMNGAVTGAGGNAIGGALSNITFGENKNGSTNGKTRAFIDENATVKAYDLIIEAKNIQYVVAVVASGQVSGSNSVGGSIDTIIFQKETSAWIGNYTAIATLRNINIKADDQAFIFGIVGNVSVSGGNGVGVGSDIIYYYKIVKAYIDDYANVTAGGNLTILADNSDWYISTVVGAAISGSTSVNGSVIVIVLQENVSAYIGNKTTIFVTGNLNVLANNIQNTIASVGSVSGSGGNAVGAAACTVTLLGTTKAYIGDNGYIHVKGKAVDYSTISNSSTLAGIQKNMTDCFSGIATKASSLIRYQANNKEESGTIKTDDYYNKTSAMSTSKGVLVAAYNDQLFVNTVISGQAAGSVTVGGSVNVLVIKETTEASAGGTIIVAQGDLAIVAHDDTLMIDSVGIGSGSGAASIGISTDSLYFEKNVHGTIQEGSAFIVKGNILLIARSNEKICANVLGISGSGTSVVNGSVSVIILDNEVSAQLLSSGDIGKKSSITADGSMAILAEDNQFIQASAGAINGSGTASAAAGVITITANNKVLTGIGSGAILDILGTTGISFYNGEKVNKSNHKVNTNGLMIGAFNNSQYIPIAYSGSGSGGGTVAIASVNVISKAVTNAIINSAACINQGNRAYHSQSVVRVVAMSTSDDDAAAGGISGAIGAVNASSVVMVINNTTTAEIAALCSIFAKLSVDVLAKTYTDVNLISVGGSGGAVSFAGTVAVLTLKDNTNAFVSGSVFTDGTINVKADSVQNLYVNAATAQVGAGAGIANIDLIYEGTTIVKIDDNTILVAPGAITIAANSNERLEGAAAGASYGGLSGTVAVVVAKVTTQALVGKGANIYATNGTLTINAIDHTNFYEVSGNATISGGLGCAVSVLVYRSTVTAGIGDCCIIRAYGDISVYAKSDRDINVASVSGNIGGGLNGAIIVIVVGSSTAEGDSANALGDLANETDTNTNSAKSAAIIKSDTNSNDSDLYINKANADINKAGITSIGSYLRATGDNVKDKTVAYIGNNGTTTSFNGTIYVQTEELNKLTVIAGGITAGESVSVGGSVAVGIFNGTVESYAGGTLNANDVTIKAFSQVSANKGITDDNKAVAGAGKNDLYCFQAINGSVGFVGLGAAVSWLDITGTVRAYLAQHGIIHANNNITINANLNVDAKSSAIGAAVGKAAAGLSTSRLKITSNVYAYIDDYSSITGAKDVYIKAELISKAYAFTIAAAGGYFGSGAAAISLADVSAYIQAYSNGTISNVSNVTILANGNMDGSSKAFGASIALNISIGAAVSDYMINNHLSADVLKGSITANNNIYINAFLNTNGVGVSDSLTSDHEFLTEAAAGAVSAGVSVSATVATITNSAIVNACSLGTLSAGDDINIYSSAYVKSSSKAYGLTVGYYAAVGAIFAYINDTSKITAYCSGVVLQADNLNIIAKGDLKPNINAIAASGGIASGVGVDAKVIEQTNISAYIENAKIGQTAGNTVDNIIVNGFGYIAGSINAQGVGVSVAVSVGVTLAEADIQPNITAYITNSDITATGDVSVLAYLNRIATGEATADIFTVNALAGAGSLIGSGIGASSKIIVSGNVNAYVDTSSIIIKGVLTVNSGANELLTAKAEGISIAGLAAVGATIVNITNNLDIQAYINASSITAFDVIIGAANDTDHMDSNTVSNNIHMNATANGTAGGIGVAIASQSVTIQDNTKVKAYVNCANKEIKAQNDITIVSYNNSKVNVVVNGMAVALLASGLGGASEATINIARESNAFVGANTVLIAGNDINLYAILGLTETAVGTASAKAIGGSFADVKISIIVNDTNKADIGAYATLTAGNEITILDNANHNYDNQVTEKSGSIIAGGMASLVLNLTDNTAVIINNNSRLNAVKDIYIEAEAVNIINKTKAIGGSGGLFQGAAVEAVVTLNSNPTVTINKDVQIISTTGNVNINAQESIYARINAIMDFSADIAGSLYVNATGTFNTNAQTNMLDNVKIYGINVTILALIAKLDIDANSNATSGVAVHTTCRPTVTLNTTAKATVYCSNVVLTANELLSIQSIVQGVSIKEESYGTIAGVLGSVISTCNNTVSLAGSITVDGANSVLKGKDIFIYATSPSESSENYTKYSHYTANTVVEYVKKTIETVVKVVEKVVDKIVRHLPWPLNKIVKWVTKTIIKYVTKLVDIIVENILNSKCESYSNGTFTNTNNVILNGNIYYGSNAPVTITIDSNGNVSSLSGLKTQIDNSNNSITLDYKDASKGSFKIISYLGTVSGNITVHNNAMISELNIINLSNYKLIIHSLCLQAEEEDANANYSVDSTTNTLSVNDVTDLDMQTVITIQSLLSDITFIGKISGYSAIMNVTTNYNITMGPSAVIELNKLFFTAANVGDIDNRYVINAFISSDVNGNEKKPEISMKATGNIYLSIYLKRFFGIDNATDADLVTSMDGVQLTSLTAGGALDILFGGSSVIKAVQKTNASSVTYNYTKNEVKKDEIKETIVTKCDDTTGYLLKYYIKNPDGSLTEYIPETGKEISYDSELQKYFLVYVLSTTITETSSFDETGIALIERAIDYGICDITNIVSGKTISIQTVKGNLVIASNASISSIGSTISLCIDGDLVINGVINGDKANTVLNVKADTISTMNALSMGYHISANSIIFQADSIGVSGKSIAVNTGTGSLSAQTLGDIYIKSNGFTLNLGKLIVQNGTVYLNITNASIENMLTNDTNIIANGLNISLTDSQNNQTRQIGTSEKAIVINIGKAGITVTSQGSINIQQIGRDINVNQINADGYLVKLEALSGAIINNTDNQTNIIAKDVMLSAFTYIGAMDKKLVIKKSSYTGKIDISALQNIYLKINSDMMLDYIDSSTGSIDVTVDGIAQIDSLTASDTICITANAIYGKQFVDTTKANLTAKNITLKSLDSTNGIGLSKSAPVVIHLLEGYLTVQTPADVYIRAVENLKAGNISANNMYITASGTIGSENAYVDISAGQNKFIYIVAGNDIYVNGAARAAIVEEMSSRNGSIHFTTADVMDGSTYTIQNMNAKENITIVSENLIIVHMTAVNTVNIISRSYITNGAASGTNITAANIILRAGTDIGTNDKRLVVNLGSETCSIYTPNGDAWIRSAGNISIAEAQIKNIYLEGLSDVRITNANATDKVTINAVGNILSGSNNDKQADIEALMVSLTAGLSIGNSNTSVKTNLITNGTIQAYAEGNINITDLDGEVNVIGLKSNSGGIILITNGTTRVESAQAKKDVTITAISGMINLISVVTQQKAKIAAGTGEISNIAGNGIINVTAKDIELKANTTIGSTKALLLDLQNGVLFTQSVGNQTITEVSGNVVIDSMISTEGSITFVNYGDISVNSVSAAKVLIITTSGAILNNHSTDTAGMNLTASDLDIKADRVGMVDNYVVMNTTAGNLNLIAQNTSYIYGRGNSFALGHIIIGNSGLHKDLFMKSDVNVINGLSDNLSGDSKINIVAANIILNMLHSADFGTDIKAITMNTDSNGIVRVINGGQIYLDEQDALTAIVENEVTGLSIIAAKDIKITQNNGNANINTIITDGNVTLYTASTAGSVINAGKAANITGNNIKLVSLVGGIGRKDHYLFVNTDGTIILETKGDIYLKEVDGNLVVEKIVTESDVNLLVDGSILLADKNQVKDQAAITANNMNLTSVNGNIGTIVKPITLHMKDNGILNAKAVNEIILAGLSDLRIGVLETVNEKKEQQKVILMTTGSLMNAKKDNSVNIKSARIELKAEGSIGTSDKAFSIISDVIKASARKNITIYSDETLNIESIISSDGDITLTSSKDTFDALGVDNHTANVTGKSITLRNESGNIGSESKHIITDSAGNGALTVVAGNNAYLTELTGDYLINTVNVRNTAVLETKENMLNASNTGEVNVSADQIILNAEKNIGSMERSFSLAGNSIVLVAKDSVYVYTPQDTNIYSITAVAGDIHITSDGSVNNVSDNNEINITGTNLVMKASGSIGSADKAIITELSDTGMIHLTAGLDIYMTEISGDVNIQNVTAQGNIDISTENNIVNAFTESDRAVVTAENVTLKALNGSIGTQDGFLTMDIIEMFNALAGGSIYISEVSDNLPVGTIEAANTVNLKATGTITNVLGDAGQVNIKATDIILIGMSNIGTGSSVIYTDVSKTGAIIIDVSDSVYLTETSGDLRIESIKANGIVELVSNESIGSANEHIKSSLGETAVLNAKAGKDVYIDQINANLRIGKIIANNTVAIKCSGKVISDRADSLVSASNLELITQSGIGKDKENPLLTNVSNFTGVTKTQSIYIRNSSSLVIGEVTAPENVYLFVQGNLSGATVAAESFVFEVNNITIETVVHSLEGTAQGNINIVNTGKVVIGNADNNYDGVNAAGTVTISARSPMDVVEKVKAAGDITLTAGHTTTKDDVLTVKDGAIIVSDNGNVSLLAGDKVIIEATATVNAKMNVIISAGIEGTGAAQAYIEVKGFINAVTTNVNGADSEKVIVTSSMGNVNVSGGSQNSIIDMILQSLGTGIITIKDGSQFNVTITTKDDIIGIYNDGFVVNGTKLTLTNIINATINNSDGNNSFEFYDTPCELTIYTGDGDDSFKIGRMGYEGNGSIQTPEGRLSPGICHKTSIYSGSGNDKFIIYSITKPLLIDSGAGDDNIILKIVVKILDNGKLEPYKNAKLTVHGGAGNNSIDIIKAGWLDVIKVGDSSITGYGFDVDYDKVSSVNIEKYQPAEGKTQSMTIGQSINFLMIELIDSHLIYPVVAIPMIIILGFIIYRKKKSSAKPQKLA